MKFNYKGVFAKTLLILLAVSFILFGIINFFTGVGDSNVAQVGNQRISMNKFLKYLNNKRNYYYQSELSNEDMDYFNSQEFINIALSELINETMLQSEIERMNLKEPKAAILSLIYNDPNLKNSDGKFDMSRFNYLLQRINMTEASYIDYISTYNSRNNFIQLATLPNLVDDFLLPSLFKRFNEYRVVDVITINADGLDFKAKKYSNEELEEYYNEHTADFIVPEEKIIAYLNIDLSKYNNEQAKNQLSKLEDLILSANNIDEIAKDFNVKKQTIRYSSLSKDIPEDLSIEILQYNQGTFSDLIYKDNNIYRVYYIEKVIPSKTLTFNEAKNKIQTILASTEKQENDRILINKFIMQMRNTDISRVAMRNDFRVKYNQSIYQNSTDYDAETLAKIYNINRVGGFTEPIFNESNNSYTLFRLNTIKEVASNNQNFVSFDTIKSMVDRSYKNTIFSLLNRYLFDINDVKINSKLLDNLQ